MPLYAPTTTAAGPVALISDDGSQTRTLKLTNDGRAYLTGNSVTERVLGSRVGSTPAVITTRQPSTPYQVSVMRPARVTVTIVLACPLGESVSASLWVGDDTQSLEKVDEEAVNYSGLVSSILGVTPTLTFQNGRTTKLIGDLSPAQWYQVVLTKTGTATVTMPTVKERIY
jgi:hypothetical protein